MEKPTEWIREQLFLLINRRYENRLTTIVTSNLSLEDLAGHHLPQVASRLREGAQVVQFTGADLRK